VESSVSARRNPTQSLKRTKLRSSGGTDRATAVAADAISPSTHASQLHKSFRREAGDRLESQDQEPTGIDDPRMHERRSRSRSLHGVRQPSVKRELGGLEQGSPDEKKPDDMDTQGIPARTTPMQPLGTLEEHLEVPCAELEPDRAQQGEVTETTYDELFPSGQRPGRATREEDQELMQTETGRHPRQEELTQIVGYDHRKDRARFLTEQPVSLVGKRVARQKPFRFPDDVRTTPIVLPSLDSNIRSAFDLELERAGIRPIIAAEVDDMAMLRLLARDTHTVTLVPPVVVKDELRQGILVEHYQFPQINESFYAITPSRRFPNQILRKLIEERKIL